MIFCADRKSMTIIKKQPQAAIFPIRIKITLNTIRTKSEIGIFRGSCAKRYVVPVKIFFDINWGLIRFKLKHYFLWIFQPGFQQLNCKLKK